MENWHSSATTSLSFTMWFRCWPFGVPTSKEDLCSLTIRCSTTCWSTCSKDEPNSGPFAVYESADDYDDVECMRDANQHDWSHECNIIATTQSDLNNLPKRQDDVTIARKIRTNDGGLGGTPTQLNLKQSVAFGLFRRHILNVKVHGQDNVQQLLLNISGAAGIGKSVFLNTVKRSVKEELGRDGFVQAAAPSGTAAYLINGKTLHSLLYLPDGPSKCLPLHSERLKGMHYTFSNVGILFIDEKSMVSQKNHHGQQAPAGGTPTLQGQAIWKSLGGPLGGLPAALTSLRCFAIQDKCR